jgi:SAM-dependent methyltransferase
LIPGEYSFTRYLEAKKSVDDRSLNRHVWDMLAGALPDQPGDRPLKIFEIGAGIGTMLVRMIERDLFYHAEYTGIDSQIENTEYARKYLRDWAENNNHQIAEWKHGLRISGVEFEIKVDLINADLYEYMETHPSQDFDLLVANAFLDLAPLPETIGQLFYWGGKDYLYYFSINYDGLTILEPVIDAQFDQLVLSLYHDTMNNRIINGKQYGDHQTGRHLMDSIPRNGGSILSAGSSDWVVYPESGGYAIDEAYFLHFIIHTIDGALRGNHALDEQMFAKWIQLRHAQIEQAQLVYIAHQMDYFGKSRTPEI